MTDIKIFECKQCVYTSSRNCHVLRHVRNVHDKRKDVKCKSCDFTCTSNSELKRHVKSVHDKIKDFVCSHCDFTSSTKGDLKQHIKSVHDKIQDYKCVLCEYKCAKKTNLIAHAKSVHEKIKDFSCELCEYICSSKSCLKIHVKRIHDCIKDLKCNQCEYTCSESSNLQRHINVCTGGRVGSSGEVKIKDVLEGFDIKYIYNQSNEHLTAFCGKNLRFDFEVHMDGKTLFIEFDGRQHFEPIRFGGISQERAEKLLKKQKKHDRIKNRFCNEYDYKLLRIPYTDMTDIKQHIIDFMKLHTSFGFE